MSVSKTMKMKEQCEDRGSERKDCQLSRQKIEELCLLGAVGRKRCHPEELTAKLGLSPLLNTAVFAAARTLGQQGLLVLSGDGIATTETGMVELAKLIEVQS